VIGDSVVMRLQRIYHRCWSLDQNWRRWDEANALEKAPFMQNEVSGGEDEAVEAVEEAVRLEASHLPSS
jgi:hypothetical protein